MTAPLKGIKVVELARILAGPWTGQTLADLGADVIKVESPQGDDTRGWGPPFVKDEAGADRDAAYFHACNRGKRSIAVDFRTQEGQDLVRRLVADADILVENFKVGGLAKYGLDYDSLSKVNPKLIYCSITGFGQDGPYAHRAGYDFMIQGMGGIMDLTGDPEGDPQKSGWRSRISLPGFTVSSAFLPPCAAATKPAKANGSTWHCSMHRSVCWPIRRSITLFRARRRNDWAMRIPTSFPTRSFRPATGI